MASSLSIFDLRGGWILAGGVMLFGLIVSSVSPLGAREPVAKSIAVRTRPPVALRVGERVSEGFRERVEGAMRSVPAPIWRGVDASGWRVHLAEFVIDAAPHLRGRRPRGWPSDTTWDHTDAVHLPFRRQLILAEKRRTTRGGAVLSKRVAGVMRHELGHAFDMAFARPYRFTSQQPEFQSCYHMDLRVMKPADRGELGYYLQPWPAGPQESFAEAFAVVLGGGSDPTHREQLERAFPSVLRYMKRRIEKFAAEDESPAAN